MRLAPVALACSLIAGSALAQAPASAPLTPADVTLRFEPGYPTRAPEAAVPGAVGAVCRVQPGGRLGACKVMEERPAGVGLGAWLLAAFAHARVGPAAKDGSPTAGRLFAFRTEVRR